MIMPGFRKPSICIRICIRIRIHDKAAAPYSIHDPDGQCAKLLLKLLGLLEQLLVKF
jgi:hypothetical protein